MFRYKKSKKEHVIITDRKTKVSDSQQKEIYTVKSKSANEHMSGKELIHMREKSNDQRTPSGRGPFVIFSTLFATRVHISSGRGPLVVFSSIFSNIFQR